MDDLLGRARNLAARLEEELARADARIDALVLEKFELLAELDRLHAEVTLRDMNLRGWDSSEFGP